MSPSTLVGLPLCDQRVTDPVCGVGIAFLVGPPIRPLLTHFGSPAELLKPDRVLPRLLAPMDFRGQRREVPPSSRPGERLLGFRRITAHEQYPRHPECGRRVPPLVLIHPTADQLPPPRPLAQQPSHVSHQNGLLPVIRPRPPQRPIELGNQEPRLTIHHTTSPRPPAIPRRIGCRRTPRSLRAACRRSRGARATVSIHAV